MESGEEIEMQIWEYLDGVITKISDRQRITHLIEHDNLWKQKYQELSAFHTSLSAHIDNDFPSMSFGRNVMEAIDQNEITKPARKYINPAIIRSIAAMFILGLTVCLVYACTQVNWSLSGNSSINVIDSLLKKLSIKSYSGALINMFIGINIILALLLTDRLLHKKHKHNAKSLV